MNPTTVTAPQDFVPFDLTAIEQPLTVRFEEVAARYPNRVAVSVASATLTYRELNRRANQIARTITHVSTGTPLIRVAIYLEKGNECISAILGVLKSGGAYVPLDPAFPESRNRYIIDQSQASLMLTDSTNLQRAQNLGGGPLRIVNLDDIAVDAPDGDLDIVISPDSLAYIIYTSGSTGKPKGVMQTHRNVLHGCMRRTNLQKVSPSDRMTLLYSCSVMGAVYCVFGALLNGASLFPLDIRERGLDTLETWLREQKITVYHSVASVFRQFAANCAPPLEGMSIRLLIFGGERVLISDIEQARVLLGPRCQIFTGLGSTETGTIRQFVIGPETELEGKVVPLGYPVDDMDVVLLGENDVPVAGGQLGEIAVRSRYNALGYWLEPEATGAAFTSDREEQGITLYRSGDMGVFHEDGLLEHRGRKDFQVKIRGFRVEVAEVEAALLNNAPVDEAVVVARELNSETQLVAYVVLASGSRLTAREIRQALRDRLPYYMIPTAFVSLNRLPRTPNDKVDRKALPAPTEEMMLTDEECTAPADDTEEAVVDICRELLGRGKIGTNQNFFDIGGHSLLATQLVARVRTRLAKTLSMRAVFEAETLQELAKQIRECEADIAAEPRDELRVVARDSGRIPLSFAQRRMWLLDQLYPVGASYNISNSVRLEGPVDCGALERALGEITARHEILRTIFPSDDQGPWQEIRSASPLSLRILDLRRWPREERERHAMKRAREVLQRSHDLSTGPLFDQELVRLDDTTSILILVFNHIIYDNIWSSGIFFRELGALYSAFASGSTSSLTPLRFQFADYASWEAIRANETELAPHLEYWRRQLVDLPEPLQLPADRPRPTSPSFRGGVVRFEVSATVLATLKEVVRAESATTFMILLAAWQVLLHRYTQQDDILVGTPTGRRHSVETEGMIGLFINNLVLRSDCSGDPSFRELLCHVRQTVIEAFAHDEVPFEELVAQLRPRREAGMSPFVQTLFIHRNAVGASRAIPGLEIEPIKLHGGGAKLDLTMSVLEEDRGLFCSIEYSADLFDRSRIERMAAHYVTLLSSVAENPDTSLWSQELLPDSERDLIDRWRRPVAVPYPANICVHDLFGQVAEKNPDTVAVVCGQDSLTYGELNQRAERLALQLRGFGVRPGSLVAVCLNRSLDLIVALLAVLKAGGAYVPLDPVLPADRLASMMEDSDAKLLIAERATVGQVPERGTRSILIEQGLSEGVGEVATSASEPAKAGAADLAYVIFTSGSTGKPKGVQITHGALVNFLLSMQKEPGIKEDDVLHTLTTVSFDIAALEIFLPLVTGARIVVADRALALDPARLIVSLEENHVSVLQATPSSWRMLLDHGWQGTPRVKVLCGGEAMGAELAERLVRTGCEVWNLYGPTETTIWSSLARVREKSDAAFVGDPIANTRLLVLSPHLTDQPIGVPGELFIGGDGLARGYLNRDELTGEKFIRDPGNPSERLYRTGDLVVRRGSGAIEFLGRMDNQVKLRGFRIELGEIEAQLEMHPRVKQSVVIAREDRPGDERLVAYVVAGAESAPEVPALRDHLRQYLPEYMVPSAFVFLSSLPLSPAGKVDRKALPAPSGGVAEGTGGGTGSGQSIERALIGIFEQILGTRVALASDNFFDLGGHSLLVLRAVAAINQHFACSISPMDFFEHASVRELVALLSARLSGVDLESAGVPSEIDEAQKAKTEAILSRIAVSRRSPCLGGLESPPAMREFWICKQILAPLYAIRRGSLRRIIVRAILKLEGGSSFTVTLRKLFLKYHRITVGDFSAVRFDPYLLKEGTKIGRYCSIFRTARFQNADHPRNTVATHAVFYHPAFGFTQGYELERTKIEVGNDVWIGDDAKILYPTRKIGDGAVIASGAVVIEDVPPYAIVGGYPAEVIRYRFSRPTIAKLLESKWWEASLAELQAARDQFMVPLEGKHIR